MNWKSRGVVWALAGAALVGFLLIAAVVWAMSARQETSAQTIRDYLVQNPDFLNENTDLLELARKARITRERAEDRARVRGALADQGSFLEANSSIPKLGNADGDITIIEFSDYQCMPCRASFPYVEAVRQADQNLRVVILPFPAFGTNSDVAARAAFAAHLQSRFHDFHTRLMTARTYINRTFVLSVAAEMGLDMERLHVDMNDTRYDVLVSQVLEFAGALGVEGPPGFVIGNSLIRGGVNQADLTRTIAIERAAQASAN